MGTPGTVDQHTKSIVLFDGVCNLCSASVQFIIKRDTQLKFQFASLQSEVGQRLLEVHGIRKDQFHSIILIQGNQFYEQSNAALAIARKLGGAWPLLYFLKIIPRFIRDTLYDWVSRNRYRFFGKKDACWLPTPELKSRFID